MYLCSYCGGELAPFRQQAVCTVCGRVCEPDEFRRMQAAQEMQQRPVIGQRSVPRVKPDPAEMQEQNQRERGGLIVAAVLASMIGLVILASGGVAALPMLTIMGVVAYKLKVVQKPDNKIAPVPVEQVRQEPLNTVEDYISAFRAMPLTAMPLRAEAGAALDQLQMLARKQEALHVLLQPGHPYLSTCNDSINYVLGNMKLILYRLRYCDLNDLSKRGEHYQYLHGLLDENAGILRDLESLIITLTSKEAVSAPLPVNQTEYGFNMKNRQYMQ